jgi:hypothetical protein
MVKHKLPYFEGFKVLKFISFHSSDEIIFSVDEKPFLGIKRVFGGYKYSDSFKGYFAVFLM